MDIGIIIGERLTSEKDGGRDVVQSDRVGSVLALVAILVLFFGALVVPSYV